VLFISILHQTSKGYLKVFEKSYYESFLWAQDFATAGLKLIRLPGESRDALLVATAQGASLGAQAEIYRWDDSMGTVNIMPDHPRVHHISITTENGRFLLTLSFEKYPGELGVPRALVYRWDGHELKTNST
jgi:hypothetical protein